MLGAGVLSLPYAAACLGWVAATLLLAAVLASSAYSAWLMATLHQLRDGRRTETLIELAGATLGRFGWAFALVFQMLILVLKQVLLTGRAACSGGKAAARQLWQFMRCSHCRCPPLPHAQLHYVSCAGRRVPVQYLARLLRQP